MNERCKVGLPGNLFKCPEPPIVRRFSGSAAFELAIQHPCSILSACAASSDPGGLTLNCYLVGADWQPRED